MLKKEEEKKVCFVDKMQKSWMVLWFLFEDGSILFGCVLSPVSVQGRYSRVPIVRRVILPL